MKILFISAEPVRPRQASETHVNEIANHLRHKGHHVTVCAARNSGPYESTLLLRRCRSYLVFWFQTLRQLHRAEVVYARAHPANFPLSLAAQLLGLPIVHEINGSYYDVSISHRWLLPLMGGIAALQRFQYRKASALIAVTRQLSDWANDQAPGVLRATVANGVNGTIFYPERPAVKAVTRDYAIFFGSLTRWHGIEDMIAAIENKAWPADLDLVIIGEGELGIVVQQASHRNSKIHIFASVPQDALAGYINGAVLGLVPINSVGGRGRYGLSPLKLYEMLACGLPLVVTDFPGQADLVRLLDAGIVIPPDDPAALAQAVAALHANSISRNKMLRVAATVHTEHSWANRAAEIEKVLTQVMGNGKL